MSFELIEAEEAHYPKALMCRALGLSRSGHHAYSTRGPSRRAVEQQQLDVLVAAIFAELGGRYGAPRIQRELRHRAHRTSRKRVAASMARQGLVARPKRRWRTTTDSNHREAVAPNCLGRDFSATAPDRAGARRLPLPLRGARPVLAEGSRLVPRQSARRGAVGGVLRRALAARRPPPGLIFHSDRGSEFAASSFRRLLAAAGAVQSMSRRGNCWDNAVAESFFSTLEFEGPHDATWRTLADAGPDLFDFIEGYYNARRLHSTNDYRSPNQTEADWRIRALAA